MHRWIVRASVFLGLVSLASAQRFGFTHQMLPADADPTRALALGDVDGDGDLDLFLGNDGQDRLYLNAGAGAFTEATATNLPAPSGGEEAVALGDVDGDGDLDAILGNAVQNRLFLNGGTGIFTDATLPNLPGILEATNAVALGDVDGDGDLDAFLGNQGQSALFLNLGAGFFIDATATNLPGSFALTRAVALGDVDGDGDLDAFLGTSGQDLLYTNNGAGVFTDATGTNLPVVLDDTLSVALGDVDGDGDSDALVGNSGQDRLYLNSGAGAFSDATATNLPALLDETRSVALRDLDGDGDLDAFAGIEGQSHLYLNAGGGIFTDATATRLPSQAEATLALALGDVDGDGDTDALLGNYLEQNRLYLNAGGGVFADATAPDALPVPDITFAVALGDLDGDGDLDAFAGNGTFTAGQQDRVFLNDGTGTLTDATATNFPSMLDQTFAAALGDVDGDGDLDALVGNAGFSVGQQSRLYLNGGTGIFTDATATNLPAAADRTFAVALGDVDGDGDLDAYLGNGGFFPQEDRLYLNDGAGTFTDASASNLPGLSDRTFAVALGDVDGDGDLDAFVGNGGASAQQSSLLLNDGTGVFTDVSGSNLSVPPGRTFSVALGDVDGDGDLDAFLGNGDLAGGLQSRLCLNSGTGIFTDATGTNLPALFASTGEVVLGDVDGDGDLDALLGNAALPGGQQNLLYLNGGTGIFADDTATNLPLLSDATAAVALGDLDGDGDLDAFLGNVSPSSAGITSLSGAPNRVYTNLTRQLSWRGIPRIGKPVVMDVRGPGSGLWVLAASLGSVAVPFPPFGTLRLHPLSLIVLGSGLLDSQGGASLSIPVPADPALVGFSLYWQAVVGPPLLFTNLEVTTLTSL